MNKQEITAALEKARKQLAVAKEQDETDFANKKIAKLEAELSELEAKEAASVDIKSEQPKPKKKVKKTTSTKKGKGVKALIKDEPVVKPLDPDCDELLAKFKERAKKAHISAKKREAKPESTKIVESVENVADSVEVKVEKLEKEGKGLSKESADKLEIYTSQFIKSIEAAIKEEKNRKEFIRGLIEKLQKML